MVTTGLEVVGREEELAALVDFLDGPPPPRIVLLEGEAGIGKTTLWREGVALGAQRGLRTLSCSPAEAETQLPFAAAGDLLGAQAGSVLDSLPPPQHRALAAALLLEDLEGPPPEPRAVALAFLGALRVLSQGERLLVAVDDVQWLDGPSAMLLEFALRRIKDEPVLFLLARRTSGSGGVPLGLGRAPIETVRTLPVGPLTLGALHRLLRARLQSAFPRPVLRRLHDASGGNPFYALELGRALAERDVELDAGRPLPVPTKLQDLVRDRIAGQPEHVRDALAAVAALAAPTVFAVGDAAALDAAADAELIEFDGDRVRFTHPLLAAEAYAAVGTERRRSIHRGLAESVGDVEERARHLALAATGADASIAAALDEAAQKAAARGAPVAAAELNDQAVRLTPPDEVESARRRRSQAARLSFVAGDTARARRLIDELLHELPPGPERARLLVLLAHILNTTEGSDAAVGACERALAEPVGEPGLQAEIHATYAHVGDENIPGCAEHAEAALRLLSEVEPADPRVEATALVAFAAARYYLGRGLERAALERAIALEQTFEPPRVASRAGTVLGEWLKYTDDFDAARNRLEAAHRAALEEGDDSSLPDILSHLAELELWAGNWEIADQYAVECLEAAEQTGQEMWRAVNLYVVALVDAHRGRVESARAYAEEALAAGEGRSPWVIGISLWVLGFLDLSLGDLPAVDRHLTRADAIAESIGLIETGQWRFHADHVEALIGHGELERAEALLDRLEARGRATDRPWALATAARCRGLLLEARGDRDGALAAFTEALHEHERLPVPFERARTVLALGSVQRRANQKRAARESLEQALAVFDELGAPLWAEKARVEMGRIGGRSAPRQGELTATEQAIADLVAAGQTNEEVAAALSLSPRTVAWNLSKIYRKVGVRSRTQLAAGLARAEPDRER